MELSQNAAPSAGVSKVRNESLVAAAELDGDGAVDGAPVDAAAVGAALGDGVAEGDDVEQPPIAKTAVIATANIRRRRDPRCSTASSSDDGASRLDGDAPAAVAPRSTLTPAHPEYLIQTVDVFGTVAA